MTSSNFDARGLHKAYCALAVKWLKRPKSAGGPGCAVAVSECASGWVGERPDAIGFRFTGHAPTDGSVLVEVKVSRADFLADAKKPHRSGDGLGSWRYYMAPKGLIQVDDLPPGWGLLEVTKGGQVKPAAGHAACFRDGGWDAYKAEAERWRFANVDRDREMFLLVRVLANTDPQKALDMVREANNRHADLLRRVDQIGRALGLPKGSSSYEVERSAWLAAKFRDEALRGSESVTPLRRELARQEQISTPYDKEIAAGKETYDRAVATDEGMETNAVVKSGL
ncbi:hypothetical protein ACMHYO_11720 [Allopusillimonas ginsengisoli]|uniref:hypothetical protein n=1 Tax=Allopusillimonas ginsengisoli TaxID=453575 RepID=UPI0039C31966